MSGADLSEEMGYGQCKAKGRDSKNSRKGHCKQKTCTSDGDIEIWPGIHRKTDY
ncbi:MAG: hypothetical protein JEZ03_16145 [Bacteroidales bacterium]|nr:hypothetical protein [Bacteroidales bacterium]